MKRSVFVTLCLLSIAAIPLLGQVDSNTKKASQPQPQKTNQDRGQQVFEQNCSRCHNPPEGFSPRISGTVAIHMRIRANLSDSDYKALLRFLNP